MTSIHGTIRIGEAQATMAATGKRQRGSLIWHWALMSVLIFGMGLLGTVLSIPARMDGNVGLIIGMIGGLLIYTQWSKPLTVWRFRKTLMARGVPLDVALSWDLSGDEIVYRIGDIVTHAPWRAVTEIFHEKGWWIVMAQGTPLFAADRLFADAAAQRAFVAEILSHMSEEARGRSGEAVKFVSSAA
jgi:hypothetical protein